MKRRYLITLFAAVLFSAVLILMSTGVGMASDCENCHHPLYSQIDQTSVQCGTPDVGHDQKTASKIHNLQGEWSADFAIGIAGDDKTSKAYRGQNPTDVNLTTAIAGLSVTLISYETTDIGETSALTTRCEHGAATINGPTYLPRTAIAIPAIMDKEMKIRAVRL